MKNVIKDNVSSTLLETEKPNECVLEYKDEIALGEGKPQKFKDKGLLNITFAGQVFKLLASYHLRTYFIKEKKGEGLLVKNIESIPVFNLVRNVAAGSLVSRFGLEEGKELDCPLIEFYLHAADKEDQLINEDHIVSFGYASKEELKEMHRMASKVNVILKDYFRRRGLKLIDFKLEFGRPEDKRIILAGDFSLESCHLMDVENNNMLLNEANAGDKAKIKQDIELLQEKLSS